MNHSLLLHIIRHNPKPLSIMWQPGIMTQSPLVCIIAGTGARKPETHTRKKISQTLVDQAGLFSIIAYPLTDNSVVNMKNKKLIGYLQKIRIIWKKIGLTCTMDKYVRNLSQNGMIDNCLIEERVERITPTNHFCGKLLVKV